MYSSVSCISISRVSYLTCLLKILCPKTHLFCDKKKEKEMQFFNIVGVQLISGLGPVYIYNILFLFSINV